MHTSDFPQATALVAIPTHRRPEMLRDALEGIRRLHIPSRLRVSVIVIDNDPAGSARAVVDAVAAGDLPIDYAREPRRGLSSARNRAIDEAIDREADALIFLDDDETPAPDWLDELWSGFAAEQADLAGGPVGVRPPATTIAPRHFFVQRSIALNARLRRVSRAIRATLGKPVTITTNNWIARMSFVRRHGLRFDPRFDRSGGEDTDFYRKVVAAGGRARWLPRARVDETIPLERLRCGYVFRRRFDSGIVRTATAAARQGAWVAVCRFTPGACLMFITGSLLLLAAPITALLTLPMALGQFGRGSGYFAGLLGARSHHYQTTTGY